MIGDANLNINIHNAKQYVTSSFTFAIKSAFQIKFVNVHICFQPISRSTLDIKYFRTRNNSDTRNPSLSN